MGKMVEKKLLSILLTIVLIVTGMSMSVFAVAEQPTTDEAVMESVDGLEDEAATLHDEELPETPEDPSVEPPEAPTGETFSLSGSINALRVDLTWDYVGADVKHAVRVWKGTGDYDVANAEDIVIDNKGWIKNYYITGSLVKNQEYSFQIGAYKVENQDGTQVESKTVWGEKKHIEPVVIVSPKITRAKAVNYSYDDKIDCKWKIEDKTDVAKCITYYRRDSSSKSTRYKTNGTNSYYTLTADKEMTTRHWQKTAGSILFYVRAYSKTYPNVYAESSPSAVVTVKNFTDEVKTLSWYCKTKAKTPLYKSSTGSSKYCNIPKGTKLVVTGMYPDKLDYKIGEIPKRIKVTYKGKTGWVLYSKANGGVKGSITKTDYSKTVKEDYINSKEYTSPTKYLIWISKYTQRFTIFKKSGGKWVVATYTSDGKTKERTGRITTGKFGYQTGSGTFKIRKKAGRVYKLTPNNVSYYFDYASYFTGGNAMHNQPFYTLSGKAKNSVNKSCQPGTLGCIRMYKADAKWIFDNCLMNTTVIVQK